MSAVPPISEPFATLPDLLRDGLDVVFVGINPSLYSAQQGHYFARTINRFWPCFSRSVLSQPARHALGVERLLPSHDRLMPDFGFGFTDLVKRPTPNITGLAPGELLAGIAFLEEKLTRFRPRLVCFQGVTIYRAWAETIGVGREPFGLGLQARRFGSVPLFVIPSPSPANARFTPAQQVEWYDRIAAHLREPRA